MEYKCQNCDYLTKYKQCFNNHINKKNKCINNNKKQYMCEHCEHGFNDRSNFYRHKKNNCKQINKNKINENLEIEKLKLEIEKLKLVNNNTINSHNTTNNNSNNNTTNVTNNINIVAYGDEDMSFLTEKQILNVLSNGREGIYKLIEMVNFNKDKPENHNIKYNNVNKKITHIYNGKKWRFHKYGYGYYSIMNEKVFFTKKKCYNENYYLKLDKKGQDTYDDFIESYENCQCTKENKDDLELLLQENTYYIKNNKKSY
jgi:hypothetical protein